MSHHEYPEKSDVNGETNPAPPSIQMEQWFGEVRLFMEETGRELQEIGDRLNLGLRTGEFNRQLKSISRPATRPTSDGRDRAATLMDSDDDPLAQIQARVSNRIRQSRTHPNSTSHPAQPSPDDSVSSGQLSNQTRQPLDADDY